VDVDAVGLVVERDVAADHRDAQRLACLGDPLDRLSELPHDLGFLRVAEVEVVDHRQRARPGHGHVESRLVDQAGRCPDPGVEEAEPPVAVGGDGQPLVGPLTRSREPS
jgi:hypothetical protein